MYLEELHILLVEPSGAQQKIIEEQINSLGIKHVQMAKCGATAIEMMMEDPPDLVLSAMHLKDQTGAEMLGEMRVNHRLQKVAFILISSETRAQHLEPVRQGGAVAIIPKPCTASDLENALYATLELLDKDELSFDNVDIGDMETLVVDDSRAARMFISQVLKSLGIENIDQAENGREASESLDRKFYDLVVTDYNMPEMNGYELVEYIRNESNQPNIPVLMVTSEVGAARIAGVAKSGVSAICDKPFETGLVKQLLRSVLSEQLNAA